MESCELNSVRIAIGVLVQLADPTGTPRVSQISQTGQIRQSSQPLKSQRTSQINARPGAGPVVLIARRKADAVLGGAWEFPGGKIEPGESPREALAREFMEEVGLRIAVGRPLTPITHRYPHGLIRLLPFLCHRADPDDTLEPRPLAVAAVRWVSPAELDAYRFPPANGPLIREIRAVVSAGG